MAGNSIRVNTDLVAQTAANIEKLNMQLMEELRRSKSVVEGLASVWEGEAASATIEAYNEFASKYFQVYEDTVNRYVQFLRVNVDQGYFEAENVNLKLAESVR